MNNIFSALMYRRDAGVIREFVLWCILCFEVLLFMISAIVAGSKISWIMLMVFTIGLAVMTAFRLTGIALLYSVGVFHLITVTIQYICYRTNKDVLSLLLFVLLILLALAALTCSFIHNFSRFHLDKVVMILVLADSVFIMVLHILLYAVRKSFYGMLGVFTGSIADFSGYWVGVVSFWILLVVVDLYYVFFVLGWIDRGPGKIIDQFRAGGNYRPSENYGNRRAAAAVQGISGEYAGQVFDLKNGELIIGSDRSAGAGLVIHDVYVSRWHCAVRYYPGNDGNGFYGVLDRSANGVYLHTGKRLLQNEWNRLTRGSVICVGGMNQQFRLL